MATLSTRSCHRLEWGWSVQVVIEELRSEKAALASLRERQALELEAQRRTLEEQRSHIAILDAALATAQAKALEAEAEASAARAAADKADKALQSSRTELRKTAEAAKRREAQLEMELAAQSLAKPRGEHQMARLEAHLREAQAQHPPVDDRLAARLAALEAKLGKREAELAEKDGIIKALVASATRASPHRLSPTASAFLHPTTPPSFRCLPSCSQDASNFNACAARWS